MPHLKRFAGFVALIGTAMSVPAFGQLQFQYQAGLLPGPNEYSNQGSLVDLDNDGDLDLAIANGQGFSAQGAALKLRILINDGTGSFTDESDARTGGGWLGWARGVEFGDIDRDGDWDMVVAQDFNKQPQLWINGLGGPQGDQLGYFTNVTATQLPQITLSSARAQFGDVDNDGDLDLLFCHSGNVNRFGTGAPKMYINDGNGFFTDDTAARLGNILTADQQDVIFGDVNSDFSLDFHLTSRASASKLYRNDGTGVFATTSGFPGGTNAYSYDFGDMDGDGDLDLLGVNGGAETFYRNATGAVWGNISSEISPNSGIDDNDSKWFDFDNDGDLDFIVGSLGSQERIYRNNGPIPTADFTQVSGIMTIQGDSTMDVEVGDINGDGKLDIITLQGESGSFLNKVYMNIGGASVVDTIAPTVVRTEDLPDTTETGPFAIRTVVYDGVTSDRGFFDKGVFLHYTVTSGLQKAEPQVVTMLWSGNSLWRGEIPAQQPGSIVEYYVTAIDYANNVGTGSTSSFEITVPQNCPADVDGSGSVNVDDLLGIINNWGTANAQYDIAPPGGDGTVNVDDLLAVINGWGNCP